MKAEVSGPIATGIANRLAIEDDIRRSPRPAAC